MTPLTDRELQSLRNMGNDAERAADEIARLRADAERYRWLRDTPWQDELRFTIMHHKNALWDAAIDAAMKGEKP